MTKSQYFQHDYNASQDDKILFLMTLLGLEGYGLYWRILEHLAIAGGKIELKKIPALAYSIRADKEKIESVINDFELFIIEHDTFFSLRLLEQLDYRESRSQDGKRGADKRWNKDNNDANGETDNIPNGNANGGAIGDANAKERKDSKERKDRKVSKVSKVSKVNADFDIFYNLYDKKIGRDKSIKAWSKLTSEEMSLAIDFTPKYKASTPDKKYRKDPATFLNNKSFNDEIINTNYEKGNRMGIGESAGIPGTNLSSL